MRSFVLRGSNPQSRATVELRPSAATSTRDRNVCSPAEIDQWSSARVGRRKRGDGRILMNRRAEFAGAAKQEFIEQAALDRDLRVVASREFSAQPAVR